MTAEPYLPGARTHENLRNFPPPEQWDSVAVRDAKAHPRKVTREFMLVPTTCCNCASACGLLAYVDKEDLSIKKVEGNPAHPGSRGRNCAKGPATAPATRRRATRCWTSAGPPRSASPRTVCPP